VGVGVLGDRELVEVDVAPALDEQLDFQPFGALWCANINCVLLEVGQDLLFPQLAILAPRKLEPRRFLNFLQ
jgi:hypothetical protein